MKQVPWAIWWPIIIIIIDEVTRIQTFSFNKFQKIEFKFDVWSDHAKY